MLNFFRETSGPVTLHMELTEACPEKCRHCYNFVRDSNYRPRSIPREDIDLFLDDFKANGGFHVILTGGEPLLAFDKLLYAVDSAKKRNLSVSLNSNLMLAEFHKMKVLREAGIDHILTTMFSHDSETHDFIASRSGAHSKILEGIKITMDAGIRVTVNMIVTNVNNSHVYETGKFLNGMGFRKFIANRMIPSTTNSNSLKKEFLIKDKAARTMIDDLLRLNKEFDMTISTCRALPHCFLGDIDKHVAFIARGCNAGKRHMLVGVDGTARACVHEAETYGNIHKIGIKGVWEKMEKWRRKDLLPEGCQECQFVDICEGGCRQIAEVVYGDWSERDNLCQGPPEKKNSKWIINSDLLSRIPSMTFVVNPDIELRKEKSFYVVRIFGAKCVLVEGHFGDFLLAWRDGNRKFTLADFPGQDVNEIGSYLIYDIMRCYDGKEDFASLLKQYK